MSMRWHLISRRPSSNTANRPTGPAPMMTTSVSIWSVINRLLREAFSKAWPLRLGNVAGCRSVTRWGERDLQAVEFGGPQDLAGQARAGLRHHGVELVLFLLRGRVEPVHPILGHEDVAGGAFAGSAAQALDGQAPIPDDLHDPPALDSLEGVALAGPVGHMDDAHEAGFPDRKSTRL